MRSPYDVLGVSPGAGDDDIRKAYHRLAKKLHPDLNPGDKAAESRFKEVNAAYDLLSDPAKRARFDHGEIDAEGRETFAHAHAHADPGGFGGGGFHFSFGGGGPEDIFESLFAGAQPRRGQDVRVKLTVDFADAALGAVRRVTVRGRTLDVTIPAGLSDGQTLRLKGQGEPPRGGGAAGDLLVEVAVSPHRLFRRQGNDLHLDVPLTLAEAVLGAKVAVPTLTGSVTMTVPAGTNTGKVLRLKGKGIKGGDLYVTLRVALPDKPDNELRSFVRDWSARHPYDPRAGM